jgi:hypothetical protein
MPLNEEEYIEAPDRNAPERKVQAPKFGGSYVRNPDGTLELVKDSRTQRAEPKSKRKTAPAQTTSTKTKSKAGGK